MKDRAPRNQTLTCSLREKTQLSAQLLYADRLNDGDDMSKKIICGDLFKIAPKLPQQFVDLLILDPPYNLSKDFHGHLFKEKDTADYQQWFQRMMLVLIPTLKSTATIYVCSDWKTSIRIVPLLENHFHVRNRITWER